MKVLAYDATSAPWYSVNAWWMIGAFILRPLFDRVIAAQSWADLLGNIEASGLEEVELHFWGHGAPGRALIGRDELDPKDSRWKRVNLIWFRTCSTMNEQKGLDLVRELQSHGVAVAGHLVLTGPQAHSHLVGVKADQEPWWSTTEVDARSRSTPWAPRTVHIWNHTLPPWLNKPDAKELPE